MNAKPKAKELVEKFFFTITNLPFKPTWIEIYRYDFIKAKICAEVAIKNEIEDIKTIDSKMINDNFKEAILVYLNEVLKEIDLL